MINPHKHSLRVKNLGIDTYRENIIFMRVDCCVYCSYGIVKYPSKQLETNAAEKKI